MAIEALVFDVDGTLADTEEAHRQAFNAAFAQHHLDWRWSRSRYAELLGVSGGRERMLLYLDCLSEPEAVKKNLREHIAEVHRTKVRLYRALVESGQVPLRAGVKRLILEARAAGLKLAVATTGTRAGVEALIESTLGTGAAGWFDALLAGEAVTNRKPAPEIYRMAVQQLGARAAACIAFEDSANGVNAAHAAGLFVVATPTFWTLDQDFRRADLLLPTLGEPDQPIPQSITERRTGGAGFVSLRLLRALHAAAEARAIPT